MEQLIKRKIKEIGLDAISVEFLNEGTSKNNYVIKTDGEKYLLKLYKKSKKEKIQNQIDIMRKINVKETLTINPVNSKVLVFGSKVGYIYKFIEGKAFRDLNIKNKIYEFGKVVGNFNKKTKMIFLNKPSNTFITEDYDLAKRTVKWLKGKNSPLQKKSRKLLLQGIKILDENYKGQKYRTQLIHGDLHDGNVYYEKGKYIIIDTDGLSNSLLAREPATFSSYLVVSSMPKTEKIVGDFIRGYQTNYPLTKQEKKDMVLFLIVRKFGEIIYLLKQESKKILTEKEIKKYLGATTEKLDIIVNNYDSLCEMFKRF